MDSVGHAHEWVRHQNVTSRGYVLPAYEVCSRADCDAARTTHPTAPADPWAEFHAMTTDEKVSALAHVAGSDPDLFARVLEASRPERVARRERATRVRGGVAL